MVRIWLSQSAPSEEKEGRDCALGCKDSKELPVASSAPLSTGFTGSEEILSESVVDLFVLDDIFFKNVFFLSGGFGATICVL